MMTQEQAAKYLIVGWVKGWSLHSYWLTAMEAKIGGASSNETKLSEAHKTFAWLPDDPYMFLKKTTCQRYIADHMPKLNDMLFACDSNQDRLKLFGEVLKFNGAGAKNKASRRWQMDRAKLKREDKKDKVTHSANSLSIAQMRRGSGHAWNVCK